MSYFSLAGMMNENSRPKVMLVVGHPDHDSATWAIARAIEQGLESEGDITVITHDLVASGFDPVYREADLAHHRGLSELPADVGREQELLESADVTVVLFPVYWWSMPALVKGWFDRVFGAYDDISHGEPSVVKQLHLVAGAGLGEGTFARHGYKTALTTQTMHGIADYSRIGDSSLEFLYDTESKDPAVHRQLIARAYEIGVAMARRAHSARDSVAV
ncbi:NAD(P)H-dependent oxidoreductase [Nocardia testacea]|uniref:NAD(P)H-dependent oxidoreductase n=1 Tax=Nocardia testacea TaxID=248551 RepID=UPI001FE13D4F|nr:NAD(P)H-dependent oxidoreductase [Nocardia testacea]